MLRKISYSGQWEMVEMVDKDVIEAEIISGILLTSIRDKIMSAN